MIDFTYPTINYLSEGIGHKKIPGFLVKCPDKEGFIYAVHDNQKLKVFLFHDSTEKIIDEQLCRDCYLANRLLEINIFRLVELALQMMYDNEISGSTISWKTINGS